MTCGMDVWNSRLPALLSSLELGKEASLLHRQVLGRLQFQGLSPPANQTHHRISFHTRGSRLGGLTLMLSWGRARDKH